MYGNSLQIELHIKMLEGKVAQATAQREEAQGMLAEHKAALALLRGAARELVKGKKYWDKAMDNECDFWGAYYKLAALLEDEK